jgi:hypothetical protein
LLYLLRLARPLAVGDLGSWLADRSCLLVWFRHCFFGRSGSRPSRTQKVLF